MKSSSKKYVSHKSLIWALQLVHYFSTGRLVSQCGNNNVPLAFMWRVARAQPHVEKVGSCAWEPTIVQTPLEPEKLVSVLVTFLFSFFFSRSEGRGPVFLAVICLTSGSVAGQCQVEQRSRIPPANPELNATPSLHEACHEQSRQSMPANDFCWGKREEGGGRGEKRVKADGFDFIYMSCHVQCELTCS